MKNNQILAVIAGAFFVAALVSFFNFWNYRATMHRLADSEIKVNYIKGSFAPTLLALVNDTSEYSKKNPAVIPILQTLTNSITRPMAAPMMAPAPMAAPVKPVKK